jgi:hypothetical protein
MMAIDGPAMLHTKRSTGAWVMRMNFSSSALTFLFSDKASPYLFIFLESASGYGFQGHIPRIPH